jgi:hypothetical protein
VALDRGLSRAALTKEIIAYLVRRKGWSYGAGVCVIERDALNAEDVLRAMERQDAVVECIGGTASVATSDVGAGRDAKHRSSDKSVRSSAAIGWVCARYCREREAVPLAVQVAGRADVLTWNHQR